MNTLDLFKSRRFTIVKLSDSKEYKIPNEYTVEQVERLLELKTKEEEISNTLTGDTEKEKAIQLDLFWGNIFAQLEIIFQSYHPEITAEYLKRFISHNEALEVVGFFQKYRALAMDTIQAEEELDAKKKLKN